MTTPEPFHRWAANEDPDARAFGLRDFCLTCMVKRLSTSTRVSGVWNNAVAAGPCPEKDWRGLDPKNDLRPYLIAYVDEANTPAERSVLASLQDNDTEDEK